MPADLSGDQVDAASPFASPPAFVGRAADLALVQSLFHDASLGRGSFLLVEGEAGVGRSRFLAECARINPRAVVLALKGGAGLVEGHDLESQLSAELGRTGRRASRRATLVSSIVDRARRKLLVVLIDDAQSATAAERTFIDTLAILAPNHRIAVIATFTGDGPRRIDAPSGGWPPRGVRGHVLRPLDDATMEILVRHLVQAGAIEADSDDVREVIATAQGNPRFAIELAAGMRAQPKGTRTPDSARAIARAAHERLSKRSYEILLLCSVTGAKFKDSWLVDTSGRRPAEVAEALQAATDLGLISEDPRTDGWFGFRHVAVRKALYATLVSLNRKTLHERIVARLTQDDEADRHAMLIAEHCEALGRREEASAWYARAAAERQGRSEFGLAAELYRRAIALRPGGDASVDELRKHQARCYERVGEWARAIPIMRSMLAPLDAKGDSAASARLLNDLVIAYLNDGDRPGAERAADEIAALGLPDRYEIALLLLAISLCFSGRVADASRLLSRVDRTKLVSDEAHLRYLLTAAHVETLRRPLDSTLALVDEAVAIARKTGARSGIVVSLGTGAEVCLRYCDLERQLTYLKDADEIAEGSAKEQNFLKRMVAHHWIGHLLVSGALPRAREVIASTLDWRDGGRHNEAFTVALGVTVGMHLGDFALVDALFDPDLLQRSIDARDAESCGLLVPAYAEIMQVRGMEKEFARAVTQCVELGYIDTCGWVQMCAARFAPADVADLAAAQIEAYFKDAVAPIAAAHLANFRALAARRRGQRAAAISAARDAAKRYGSLGWRLSEASALELAGEISRAIDIYERCSASADVARLRAHQTRKETRAPFGARLTPRELEVARLAGRTWSNGDISRALGISVRTIDHHLEAAFSKLGIRARWQLTDQLLDPLVHETGR